VDAVGAADTDRILVLEGTGLERLQHHVQICQQLIGGLGQLHRQTGVQHVGGGHALMDKTRLGTDVLGHRCQKGNHIMLDLGLDLIDTGDIKITLGADDRYDLLRDNTQLGLGLAGQGLNLQPDLKTVFSSPYPGHLRTGIAFDHAKAP
jgi:hypothetical protein